MMTKYTIYVSLGLNGLINNGLKLFLLSSYDKRI